MATSTEQSDFDAIVQARAEHRKVPTEVERRVRERAAKAREIMVSRFGLQDIGTEIIREHRETPSRS